MSWFSLPKVFTDYWGPEHPNTRIEDEAFTIVDKELKPQLAEAIASHLSIEGEKFQATLTNRFNLTLMSELEGGNPTKVWLVVLTKQTSSK